GGLEGWAGPSAGTLAVLCGDGGSCAGDGAERSESASRAVYRSSGKGWSGRHGGVRRAVAPGHGRHRRGTPNDACFQGTDSAELQPTAPVLRGERGHGRLVGSISGARAEVQPVPEPP